MNRKTIAGLALAATAAAGLAFATLGSAQETDEALAQAALAGVDPARQMAIYRPPGCGCCDAYADYMREHGYRVEVIDDRGFVARSIEAGVPAQGLGCHLATVDGYVVSGLVPADIVARLTKERPEITGITLPGMPANAPGMAPEKTGTLKIYAFDETGVSLYSNE